MADMETLRTLFVEHHLQLATKRQKIHSYTERTIGVLMIIAGWLAFTENKPVSGFKWLVVVFVLILAYCASAGIFIANRGYMEVAKVIEKINFALGMYDKDAFISGETLYPEDWKGFGTRNRISGVLHHLLVVWFASIMCILAAILK